MKKIGKLVSVYEIYSSSVGKIHRGFKIENEKRERILFYEFPFSLKIPEENPQHISILDINYREQEKDYTLIAHPYISGFPLSEVLKRCNKESFPLPLDHSLLIIERITSAFDLFKYGFPYPFFIWLTFDGEVKCSPVPYPRIFQKVKNDEILNYLSPQLLQGDDWGRTDQVYSTGALFFELLTGKRIPVAKNEDEVIQAIVKTPLAVEGPIPKDLQVILLKALCFRSNERFQHIKDLREELGKLIYSGAYSPTTFNLAFFMHSIFREEIEKEEKTLKEEDLLEFTELFKPPKVEPPPVVLPKETATPSPPVLEKKGKSPFLFVGISIVAIILVVLSIFLFKGQKPQETQELALSQETEKVKKLEEEYKKKLQELELEKKKREEEIARLQKEALKNPEAQKEIEKKKEEQKKTEEKLKEMEQKKKEIVEQKPPETVVPKKEEPPVTKPVEEPKKEEPVPQKEDKPQEQLKPEQKETPQQIEEIKKPSVKEGDLVPMDQVDIAPVPIEQPQPETPPLAKIKKEKAKVTLKVLVNHKGEVENVEVLSVNPPSNIGFDKASIDAVKKWKFQPALKEGVKVKCWFIVRFNF